MRKPTVILRWLSRLNFTDSLVLIFLILGALWLLRFLITSSNGQDLSRIGFVPAGAESDVQTRVAQDKLAKGSALSRDPIRIINGKEERTGGPGWVHLFGKVVGVFDDGVNIRGFYLKLNGAPLQEDEEITFFLSNFPHALAEGDVINSEDWVIAKDIGIRTYTTPLRGPRGIHLLDYGQLPGGAGHKPTQSELDAVLAQAIKDRQETDARMAARSATNKPPAVAVATNPAPTSPAPGATSAK